jgi:hypothetical protein
MSEIVCVAFPTIHDGLVLRWYRSVDAYELDGEPLCSASRNGVMITGYLHKVPAEVLAKAEEAYEILRDNGPRELAAAMATHLRKSMFIRELVPIEREATDG